MLAFACACACSLALATNACRRASGSAPDIQLAWTWTPSPPVVGTATLTMTLRDQRHEPLRGAVLAIEGHMSHPGMQPVLATAKESGDGIYTAVVAFTMPGDWIVLINGTAPGGQTISRRIDVAGVHAPPR
jgi:hypothetical protein